jgi:hypothetical protein
MDFIGFRVKGAVKLTGNGPVGKVTATNRLVRLCVTTDAPGSMDFLLERCADSPLDLILCARCVHHPKGLLGNSVGQQQDGRRLSRPGFRPTFHDLVGVLFAHLVEVLLLVM